MTDDKLERIVDVLARRWGAIHGASADDLVAALREEGLAITADYEIAINPEILRSILFANLDKIADSMWSNNELLQRLKKGKKPHLPHLGQEYRGG